MEMDKKELRKLICELLHIPKITLTIENQIHRYVIELGLSYKEIAQALVFFLEVEKGEIDPKFGIGIVPHVVERAKEYFLQLKKQREQQINSIKEAEKQPDIILRVGKLKKRRKLGQIEIDKIDVD